jgi:hypothetical protein
MKEQKNGCTEVKSSHLFIYYLKFHQGYSLCLANEKQYDDLKLNKTRANIPVSLALSEGSLFQLPQWPRPVL